MTYRELDDRLQLLAGALSDRGMDADAIVSVVLTGLVPTIVAAEGGIGRVLDRIHADASTLDLPEDAAEVPADGWPLVSAVALWKEWVEREPEAIAVVEDGRQTSRGELNRRANQLARELASRGVRPDDVVSLIVPRSLEWIIGMLAAWKLGAAYSPLDPTWSIERTEGLIESSGARAVVALSSWHALADAPFEVTVLDDPDTAARLEAHEATDQGRDPWTDDDAGMRLAYVISTSGSTGRPKPTLVPMRGVSNTFQAYRRMLDFGEGTGVLMANSPLFDLTQKNIWVALAYGGVLHLSEDGFDPQPILRQIGTGDVQIANMAPSAFEVLADLDTEGVLTNLGVVILGGEQIRPAAYNGLIGSGTRMINSYGPTEASDVTSIYELDLSAPDAEQGQIPIGTAWEGVDYHVLDGRLRPVPAGITGELYIGGNAVGRGYGGMTALTASRFIASPFGTGGARLYRTGDLVRERSDGELVFLGRSDFQVKIRGLRIELGEIESALVANADVLQSIVVVHDDNRVQRLVGYVTAAAGTTIDTDQVLADLGRTLPAYMVPDLLVVLDEMPLNTSGKIDRKALPRPQFASHSDHYREPSTPAEIVVAQIFGEILGIERVGADDSFFEIGGNSLSAARVVARANAALGSDVNLREVFDAPTVAGLAALAAAGAGTGRRRPELVAQPRLERIPLSLAQSRMWFINQFDTSSPAYNLPLGSRLTGALDTEALAAAVTSVLERHESLRTVFPDDGDGPHQVVLPADGLDIDLTPVEVRDDADMMAALADLASRGFDVTVEIPVRPRLFRLAENEHVLLFLVHHISSDGASMAPLARDIVVAYSSWVAGERPEWAPLEVQYADFAMWQRELLGVEDDPESLLARQVGYWVDELAGIPDVLPLPTDRPRPAVISMEGARVEFEIGQDLQGRLLELAREQEATLFTAVHAAFALLLSKLSGTDDIVLGTPTAGRGERELDDLVGMFVNTLALRTVVDPAKSFVEMLRSTRESDIGALAHADVPFERLVELLAPERSTAHAPIFQVVIALENTEEAVLELPDLVVSPVDPGVSFAKFDLQLSLGEKADRSGMNGTLVYATDLFDESSVRTLGDRFVGLLEALVADPSIPVGDVEITDPAERAALLRACGPTVALPRTLPEILAAAASDREATALVSGDRTMTYGELDDRSNALARTLIDRGVGPESFVALALGRSIESQIALWAVAKSGAAFLPMDPAYPFDRIEHMLTDSGAMIGLTLAENSADLPDASWLVLDSPQFASEWERQSTAPVTDADRVAPVLVDNSVWVIYTSGSTGRPKGVVVTHSGLSNLEAEARDRFQVTSSSRVLHLTSPSFDASLLEFLMAVGNGATFVIVPPDVYGGGELADIIVGHQASHAFITPSAAAALSPEGLDSLTCLVMGGEAVTEDSVVRWAPGRHLHNGYGPTETTVMAMTGDALVAGEPVTIGEPSHGVTALVLDGRLRPVPLGVAGELYLAGSQTARGYHDRPSLTADRFVANPYATDGSRMYRTGDVVRWVDRSESADLSRLEAEYVGRSDFQVKVRGFRIELGEIDAALARHETVDFAVTIGRPGPSGATVLVSYVVPVPGTSVEVAELSGFVAAGLPAHMVPSAIVVLDAVPLTVNGKLDRKALPEPDFGSSLDSYVAPSSPIEETLAGLFAEVLGVDRVSVADSFFALGGDSIVSIQLVSRAKAAGVVIKARDVFERKSVAGLAQVAMLSSDAAAAVLEELPGGAVGDMPLLPVARWAIDNGAGSRFSQAVLLTAPVGLDRETLAATVTAVLDQHAMLRSVLVTGDDGVPILRTRETGAVHADGLIERIEFDSDSLPGSAGFEAMAATGLDVAADRLDPAAGVMAAVVWFDPAPELGEMNGRLLLVLHHLVVDGVSWRLLVPALAAAWGQITAGAAPTFEPEVTSARRWAHALVEEAGTESRVAELGYWREVLARPETPIGSRPLDAELDTMATRGQVSLELPADVTDGLLTAVPARFRGGAQDGLLAALAVAVAAWRRARGAEGSSTLITLEGHGREDQVAPGADLSRTVGWFTSVYPVRLDIGDIDLDDALAGGAAAGAAVKAVKEQLLTVPDNGIGYGLLRYLNSDTGAELSSGAVPQISFNYLGRFGTGELIDEIRGLGWMPVSDGGVLGGAADAAMAPESALEINASVLPGGGLSATLSFATGVLTATEIEEFAGFWRDAMTAISAHARTEAAGGLTPSDLPLVSLSQDQIELFESRYPSVEDLWSLSPLQHGLLFHALLTEGMPDVVDVYTAQFVLDLAGSVDAERLRRATDRLLVRNPNLRSVFLVDEAVGSVQVVVGETRAPLTVHDLSGLDEASVSVERGRILDADRAAGFDMATPPLIRLTLLALAADRWQLVFTNHHVILDGWSTPLVIRELMALYAMDGDDSALPRSRDYKDYLQWLAEQDRAQSLETWRTALAGVDDPTLLAPAVQGVNHAAVPGKVEGALTAEETARAEALAAELGVTLNTLVQTAWALVLGMLSGRGTVVFGATVSGRPADLSGVESMAGLFINTIPVAVRLDSRERVRDLLVRLQSEQAGLLDHHFVGLTDIHRAAGDAALFDTAVIYESYPVDTSGVGGDVDIAGMRLMGVESAAASHFPLSIVTAPVDGSLHLAAEFQHEAFDEATVAGHLDRTIRVLREFVAHPDANIGALQLITDEERATLERWNDTALERTAQTLLERIDARTSQDPDAPALVAGGITVTRGELDRRANRLAHELIAAGVGIDDVVALIVPRSVDWVVGMLAAWKVGAAYLPVDPKAPADRIAAILEDCEVAAVVLADGWSEELAYSGALMRLGDADTEARLAGRPDTAPPNRWTEPGAGHRLAYVITTSGSTGRPKPTLVPMAGVLNTAEWYRGEILLAPGDGALVANSPVFDQTQKNVWVTLSDGGVLHLAADPFDPVEILEIIGGGSVVNANMAPSAFATLLDADADQSVLPRLRSLHLGGESFNPARLAHLEAAGTRLHNNYGPTEATDMITDHRLSSVLTGYPDGRVPIGPALPNYELYVLDQHLRLVPPGVAGELYIGGVGVSRGY
ncbi:amino acid adenylation domain-containing protein, partial [Rhodococcus daqingensis]